MKKRMLSFIMAIVLLIACLPLSVFAASPSGSPQKAGETAHRDSGEITLSNEEYYRLLYINQIETDGSLLYIFEKENLNLGEISFDEKGMKVLSCLNLLSLGLNLFSSFWKFPGGTFASNVIKAFGSALQYISIFQVNANTAKMLNQLSEQLQTVYEALHKDLEKQNQVLTNKMDSIINVIRQEAYAARFQKFYKEAFSDGKKNLGYLSWKEYLFNCYDGVLNAQKTGSEEDLKIAFDRLYNAANQVEILTSYLTGSQYVSDISIQEMMYRYYLLRANTERDVTMDEAVADCVDIAKDFNTTVLFSSLCLNLCYQFQTEYLKKQYGEAYSSKSYQLSGGAQDPYISFNGEILPHIKGESSVERGRKNATASLVAYMLRILNLDATYGWDHQGNYRKVIYEVLSLLPNKNTQPVANRSTANGQPIYFFRQNQVSKGDVLYLSGLPDIMKNSFDGEFRFVCDNTSVATVTDAGVVTVKGNSGSFTVQALCNGIVAYSMTFTVDPAFSFAGGGIGTAENPYIITSVEELKKITSDSGYWESNLCYQLGRDLDLSGVSLGQIGTLEKPFQGHFNGNGYTLENLSGKSLFGYNNGTIENLTVKNADIYSGQLNNGSYYYIGGLVIENGGTISDCCFIDSKINSDNPSRSIHAANGELCLFTGGICAVNHGTVQRCVSSGNDISGHQENKSCEKDWYTVNSIAGGLVGRSYGTVTDCLSANNTVYQYIKSHSYFVCILWEKTHFVCGAVFLLGSTIGSNQGEAERCLAYGNNVSHGWDHATDQNSGNTKNWYDDGYCYPTIDKNQFALSDAVAAGRQQEFEKNGWTWGNAPSPLPKADPSAITVEHLPNKTVYYQNETVNPDGLLLKTDTGMIVTHGYVLGKVSTNTLGKKTVTVRWNGLETDFSIEVICAHDDVKETSTPPEDEASAYHLEGTCLNCKATVYSFQAFPDTATDAPDKPPVNDPLPVIAIDRVSANGTGDIQVKISLKNNPGIASMKLSVVFDDELLTLKKIDYGMKGEGQSQLPQHMTSPVILNWINATADTTGDCVYATLTFSLKEGVKPSGDIAILAAYEEEDIFNISEKNIAFAVEDGAIRIVHHIPGDINGDLVTNNKDLTRFFQYLSGWNVEVNTEALDVNADGKVNNKDLTRLFQGLSGWDVELH